ncbi:MAG: Holliday junction resolvase RuvX [Candidatus Pacebacteria bacterium CG_4_10_14_0_8_um_filter_42_14]|nr:MAG: Holliday junction resolvase RuvX [Candidatus Pacebacteria bacterium CG_4_10_14_0_8_um_filter_42_14]
MTKQSTLGIDYGVKRIGVAVSYHSLAEPLKIVPHGNAVFADLQRIIDEHNVGYLVFGISDGEMAEKTRIFAEKLKLVTGLPLAFIDEAYSSKQVHEKMKIKRGPRASQHKPIDHYVAAELLQEWLDSKLLQEERYA